MRDQHAARRERVGRRVQHQDRGGDALGGAAGDQPGQAGCERAAERGQTEEDEAGHEDAPRVHPIAEGAGGEDEGGEGSGVGVHDPVQTGDGAVDGGAEAGEGDVDDGDVELDDGGAEAHGGERTMPGPARPGACHSTHL